MRGLSLVLMLMAGPALAWEPMDPADLAGKTLRYQNGLQSFEADGATVYTTDKDSHGNWRAEGGQYCSAWPPSARWDCYALEQEGAKVRFIARDRSITEGVLE